MSSSCVTDYLSLKKAVIRIITVSILSINMLSYLPVHACSVCGCAPAAGFIGVLPRYDYSLVGYRAQYRFLNTTHPPLFENEAPTRYYDHFITQELWTKVKFARRWSAMAFVPYNWFQMRDAQSAIHTNHGIGDASAMLFYHVINNGDSMSFATKQALMVGLGAKVPSGRWQAGEEQNVLLPANMQIGTGSMDIPLAASYTLRGRHTGITAELSYRINQPNAKGYKFGNTGYGSVKGFAWLRNGGYISLASAGLYHEWWQQDLEHQRPVSDPTGGYNLGAICSADVYYRNISLGLAARLPLAQHIAASWVQQRWHITFQTLWIF